MPPRLIRVTLQTVGKRVPSMTEFADREHMTRRVAVRSLIAQGVQPARLFARPKMSSTVSSLNSDYGLSIYQITISSDAPLVRHKYQGNMREELTWPEHAV